MPLFAPRHARRAPSPRNVERFSSRPLPSPRTIADVNTEPEPRRAVVRRAGACVHAPTAVALWLAGDLRGPRPCASAREGALRDRHGRDRRRLLRRAQVGAHARALPRDRHGGVSLPPRPHRRLDRAVLLSHRAARRPARDVGAQRDRRRRQVVARLRLARARGPLRTRVSCAAR